MVSTFRAHTVIRVGFLMRLADYLERDRDMQMTCPRGLNTVEHDDGKIHAVDMCDIAVGLQLWRNAPVCGAATGPSSDEAGKDSWLMLLDITCRDCIAILG